MKKILVCATGIMVTIAACSKNSTGSSATVDCSGEAKSYAADVEPVIQSSCATSAACHGSGSNNGPGALTTYQQVYNARAAIRVAVANGSMPQGISLSTTNKNAILCWVDNGAENN